MHSPNISAHDNVPPYQAWLQKVECNTPADRHTHRDGDSSILSPNFVMVATISNLPLFSCVAKLALIIKNILIRDKQTDKFHFNITIFFTYKMPLWLTKFVLQHLKNKHQLTIMYMKSNSMQENNVHEK